MECVREARCRARLLGVCVSFLISVCGRHVATRGGTACRIPVRTLTLSWQSHQVHLYGFGNGSCGDQCYHYYDCGKRSEAMPAPSQQQFLVSSKASGGFHNFSAQVRDGTHEAVPGAACCALTTGCWVRGATRSMWEAVVAVVHHLRGTRQRCCDGCRLPRALVGARGQTRTARHPPLTLLTMLSRCSHDALTMLSRCSPGRRAAAHGARR